MKKIRDMDEQELVGLMNLCGRSIENTCKFLGVEHPHFLLLLFNDPEICRYASNCRRDDVITAMRETADRLERCEDVER